MPPASAGGLFGPGAGRVCEPPEASLALAQAILDGNARNYEPARLQATVFALPAGATTSSLTRRGVFFAPSDEGGGLAGDDIHRAKCKPAADISARDHELCRRLGDLWRLRNPPSEEAMWALGELDAFAETLPRAVQMVEAIVASKAQENGIDAKDVVVAVGGYQNNLFEIIPWLMTGAKAYAVEANEASVDFLNDSLNEGIRKFFPNLVVLPARALPHEPVDVYFWNFPTTVRDSYLYAALKQGGLLALQTEHIGPAEISGGTWNDFKIVFAREIDETDSFLPSIHLSGRRDRKHFILLRQAV